MSSLEEALTQVSDQMVAPFVALSHQYYKSKGNLDGFDEGYLRDHLKISRMVEDKSKLPEVTCSAKSKKSRAVKPELADDQKCMWTFKSGPNAGNRCPGDRFVLEGTQYPFCKTCMKKKQSITKVVEFGLQHPGNDQIVDSTPKKPRACKPKTEPSKMLFSAYKINSADAKCPYYTMAVNGTDIIYRNHDGKKTFLGLWNRSDRTYSRKNIDSMSQYVKGMQFEILQDYTEALEQLDEYLQEVALPPESIIPIPPRTVDTSLPKGRAPKSKTISPPEDSDPEDDLEEASDEGDVSE